jgi:hypothetical protein
MLADLSRLLVLQSESTSRKVRAAVSEQHVLEERQLRDHALLLTVR